MPQTYLTSVPFGCWVFRWRHKSVRRDNVTPQSGHLISGGVGRLEVDCVDIVAGWQSYRMTDYEGRQEVAIIWGSWGAQVTGQKSTRR